MSQKELGRVEVIALRRAGKISQAQAARRLQLSERQVRRLEAKVASAGAAGLRSQQRGRPSNRAIPAPIRSQVAALIQCGGIAHADEFHRELVLVLGGREQDWARTMQVLGDRGLVFASDPVEDGFYYLVPEPLVDQLLEHLESELALPTFQHEDVRVMDQRPFCPPLDFSLTTLARNRRPPPKARRAAARESTSTTVAIFGANHITSTIQNSAMP